MKSFKWISESQFLLACKARLVGRRADHSEQAPRNMRASWPMLLVLVATVIAALSEQSQSQSLRFSEESPAAVGVTAPGKLDLIYVRPTKRAEVDNYVFDAFGPYSISSAAFAAGINQWSNTPPEWKQGVNGFSKRFGSGFAIGAIGTTARYGLAGALKEDTLYYRCECSGPFPRLRHAVISTLTGRRGEDGHRAFSFSALAAPYASSTIAIYAWYPARLGAKDAFRMGNYSMLESVGGNIALEFFYKGPHALLSRMHLNDTHGSTIQGPDR